MPEGIGLPRRRERRDLSAWFRTREASWDMSKVEQKDDGDGQKLRSLRGFRVVHVFDISQSEGEPIEDLDAVRPQLLEGEAPTDMWAALVAAAEEAGYEVVRDRKGE